MHDGHLPSSADIQRARRIAARNRAVRACSVCKRARARCADYRPCKRCIETHAVCLEPSQWRVPPATWLLVPAAEPLH